MFSSSVTLSYSGRNFTFAEDAERVLKGKLACDCTKSLLIREYCDHDFPALKCGHQIAVVSLEAVQNLSPR
jgi:ribosomal protein L13